MRCAWACGCRSAFWRAIWWALWSSTRWPSISSTATQWALLAARIPNALVLSVVNTLLVRILLENKALTALVRKA